MASVPHQTITPDIPPLMLSNNYVNTISHKPYFINSHDYTNVYIEGNEVLKTKINSPYTNITNVHVASINNTDVYSPYNSITNLNVPSVNTTHVYSPYNSITNLNVPSVNTTQMFTHLIIVLQILMYHL